MVRNAQSGSPKETDRRLADRGHQMSISLTADPFSSAVSLLSAIALNVETLTYSREPSANASCSQT